MTRTQARVLDAQVETLAGAMLRLGCHGLGQLQMTREDITVEEWSVIRAGEQVRAALEMQPLFR